MAWLGDEFDHEYWQDFAEGLARDEDRARMTLYGDRTRSGEVVPLGSTKRPHWPVDVFQAGGHDDDRPF
jgi:hypothetical protein